MVRPSPVLDLSAGLGYQARPDHRSGAHFLPTLKVGDPRLSGSGLDRGPRRRHTTVPLAGNRASFSSTLSYSYTGGQRQCERQTRNFPRRTAELQPSSTCGLPTTFMTMKLALVGKNLTNVEANPRRQPLAPPAEEKKRSGPAPRIVVNPPRMIGAEFRMKF